MTNIKTANMQDCLFCKIIAKEIPSEVVYEDDSVFCFLDIHPVNPGHVLVVPKSHFENLEDLPDGFDVKLMSAIKKMTLIIKRSLGYEATNLMLNNGVAAGQVIPHVHFHVIPRKAGDGYEQWHGKDYGDGQAAEIAGKIRAAINTNN
jgi:histidine triad (HIT) family protein